MIDDAVSAYMLGIRSISGFLILYVCYPADDLINSSENRLSAFCYTKAAVTGLIVFVMTEQLLPFIWTTTEYAVYRVGWGEGIAMYVVSARIPLWQLFYISTM